MVSPAPKPLGSEISPWESLVSHAERYWQAEEENARRLARRANLVLFVIAALLGLGPFQIIDEVSAGASLPMLLITYVLMIAAIIALVRSGLFILGLMKPKERKEAAATEKEVLSSDPTLASRLLQLPNEVELAFGVPPEASTDWARMHIYAATTQAGVNLSVRNARRNDEIDAAQQELIGAIALVILTLMVYGGVEFFETHPFNDLMTQLWEFWQEVREAWSERGQ